MAKQQHRRRVPFPAALCTIIILALAASTPAATAQELPPPAQDGAAARQSTAAAAVAPSSSSTAQQLPAACTQLLQTLHNSSSNGSLPLVLIQLVNVSQGADAAGATPAQRQLLAKGPHLPGLLTTCGSPDSKDVDRQPVRLRVRGSSSAVEYAKKSFSLDPVDQVTDFAKAKADEIDFLGLPKDKDWVLHGPENDRTLGMRSWLGYGMARWMGRYASRTQYFELFLNTDPTTPLSAQHYRGVYMLQEKVARGKHRVNVTKLDFSADPSGGYLLAYENDNIDPGAVLVTTRLSKLTLQMEYPNTNNESVVMWLQQWMNSYESKLLSLPVANLSDALDVPAAIDYFLITEITKNPDGYRGSIKMHKDRGGPLVLGPIWDLNEAFGLCCGYPIEGYQAGGASNGTSGGSAISAAGWRFNICQDPGRCRIEPADGISQWYRRLWQDATFRTAAAARWQELRAPETGALRDQVVTDELAALKRLLGSGPGTAGQRNFDKWGAALNVPGFGLPFADWPTMFDAEVKLLSDWVLARLRWLDAAFAAQALPSAGPDAYLGAAAAVAEPQNAGPVRPGAAVLLTGGAGGGNGVVPAAVAAGR